jgi:hypothetical protein
MSEEISDDATLLNSRDKRFRGTGWANKANFLGPVPVDVFMKNFMSSDLGTPLANTDFVQVITTESENGIYKTFVNNLFLQRYVCLSCICVL